MKKTRLFIGIGLTFFGLVGLTTDFEAFAEEGFSQRLASMLFITFPVIGIGIYLVWSYFKKNKQIQNKYIERTTLQLVEKFHGKITVTDLAANSELSLSESKTALENFCYKGFAVREIAESGATVYHFKTVLSTEEKDSAKGIYDI